MINLAYFDFSDKKKRKLAKSHSFEKQVTNITGFSGALVDDSC